MLKCVGCGKLKRKYLMADKIIAYTCDRLPYACTIVGMMYPGKASAGAAEKCNIKVDSHCILCETRTVRGFGEPKFAYTCDKHFSAWSKWLEADPSRTERLQPRGRMNIPAFLTVFREFVEECRAGR